MENKKQQINPLGILLGVYSLIILITVCLVLLLKS